MRRLILVMLVCITRVQAQGLMEIPDVKISYLGDIARPEGVEGLRDVPAERATALLFTGGFGFGAAGALRAALDAAPHVRLVAFDSPGGRPLVADQVASLIQARHLDTYVANDCASACTVAFAAGTVRSASPRARFAFHLAASIALEGLSNIEFVRMERRWFVRGGISLSFGNRALHAPNLHPYLPPLDELVAAGYLHRINGVPSRAPDRIPPGDIVFETMRSIEPQTASILLAAHRRRVAAGMAEDRSRAIALDNAALVTNRWLSRSSDIAIEGLADATLAILASLDPVSCMRWQLGITDQEAGLLAAAPSLRERLHRAQAGVMRDANKYPMPLPPETYEVADTEIRTDIATKYGKSALRNASTPEHAFDDPATSCAVSIAYLKGLRERPEGPSVMRWALAAG